MKIFLTYAVLIVLSLPSFSQKIELDIFNDLSYTSIDNEYKAYLKQDIFDNLTFSDNRSNKILFEKKYLDLKYPSILSNSKEKYFFFRSLLGEYREENNYQASYTIDIFDKLKIKDNRGWQVEVSEDIHGNPQYLEKQKDKTISVKKMLNGTWEYTDGSKRASLRMIHNYWEYKDSEDNKFQISKKTWQKLIERHGAEEVIFHYLIYEFLGSPMSSKY